MNESFLSSLTNSYVLLSALFHHAVTCVQNIGCNLMKYM